MGCIARPEAARYTPAALGHQSGVPVRIRIMPNIPKVAPQLQRLLLVLFLVCVGMIWIKSLRTITTSADTSYPESAIVQTARLASQSGRLYPALDAPPYTAAPYGPLF